jgi:hypothetical protein
LPLHKARKSNNNSTNTEPGRPMPRDTLEDAVKTVGDEDNIDGVAEAEKTNYLRLLFCHCII